MSENEAVALAQQGDSVGFEFIYRLHQPVVFHRVRKMLRDEYDAEEVTQDIFLTLWQKIKQYNHKSSFSTWLFKITNNKVIAYIRHKNSRIPVGNGEEIEVSVQPNQLVRLEILEGLAGLTDLQQMCVEAEWSGQSLKKYGGSGHLRKAKRELEEYLV